MKKRNYEFRAWSNRVGAMREIFGDSVFTRFDVARELNISWTAAGGVTYLVNSGDLFVVVSGYKLRSITNGRRCASFYSFDADKDVDDVLAYLDGEYEYEPVPAEEQTLDVQLFGEERARYEFVRAARMRGFVLGENELFNHVQRMNRGDER